MRIALLVLQVISALGLIATVLLQSGKSAGLSGSITGGADALFGGSKKGLNELFNKLSTSCAVLFMILTLLLSIMPN